VEAALLVHPDPVADDVADLVHRVDDRLVRELEVPEDARPGVGDPRRLDVAEHVGVRAAAGVGRVVRVEARPQGEVLDDVGVVLVVAVDADLLVGHRRDGVVERSPSSRMPAR
jgi:hypothetical protein